MTIEWQYFFGGASGKNYDRYYKAEVNGIAVEKHSNRKGTRYSIGNMDKARVKYLTEADLIKATEKNGSSRV